MGQLCTFHPVICVVLLRAAVTDRVAVKAMVADVHVTPFVPRSGVVIHTTDSEATAAASGMYGEGGCVVSSTGAVLSAALPLLTSCVWIFIVGTFFGYLHQVYLCIA